MIGALSGYVIGVTADRRSDEQISMLAGRGAECIHAPTIKTHPLRPEAEIRAATETLLAAPPDIVVLTTGIGVRGWIEAADSIFVGDQLRKVLGEATLLSRGPKARGAAVTADLDVAWNAPNATSDEVLAHLATLDLEGKRVAVQLDGAAGTKMLEGMRELGVETQPVPVYRWSLPDDVGPAESLVRAVCDRRVDAVTFTARPAVENFVEIAESTGRLDAVIEACHESVSVFAIGPVCAGGVREAGLGVPLQPERSRLGALIMYVTAVLSNGNASIDVGGQRVSVQGRMVTVADDEPVLLAGRERQVFDVLLERPGVVYSKAELLAKVWGHGEEDQHVVEVTVGRLRQRLGKAGVGVETVMRRGYRVSAT